MIPIKKCTKCKNEQPITSFYKGNDRDGLRFWCKDCHNADVKQRAPTYYSKHHSKRKRKENWDKVFALFGGRKCCDCGIESEGPIFDLHHIDATSKYFTPSTRMHYNWDSIKHEVEKCILLCANCHRIRHWEERKQKEEEE